MSNLLDKLYRDSRISAITNKGQRTDRLGDVYEDFVVCVFKDLTTINQWLAEPSKYKIESDLVAQLLNSIGVNNTHIQTISATKNGLGRSINGGNPKTDVVVYVQVYNSFSRNTQIVVPLSIKQTTRDRITIAEYDVESICSGVGIVNPRIIRLMTKHQTDGSARNFTTAEKHELCELLIPHREKLVRWCLSLSALPSKGNVLFPDYILRFELDNNDQLQHVRLYTISDYANKIVMTRDGLRRRVSGFKTGLSWTYATGSKGHKIQFKG